MREESFLEPTENGLVRTWVSWLFLLLSPLIFFISLVSNILTIVVILRTKFLHTKTNFYLCSLAISDLLLLLFSLPHHFVVELHPRWWPTEQDWVCKGRNLVKESATNASILTIMAFTFERYMAICKPFRPCGSLNPRKVVGHILLIWSLSIGFASILAYQMKMGPADSGLYVDKLK